MPLKKDIKDEVARVKALLKNYSHRIMHLAKHSKEIHTNSEALKKEYKNAVRYCSQNTLELSVRELESINKRLDKIKKTALKILNDE